MREKHHESHHQDQVTEYFPVLGSRTHHCAKRRNTMMLPCLRFLDPQANVEGQQCWDAANPEHVAPSPYRQNETRGDPRQDVTDGISSMQNGRKDTTPSSRDAFHCKISGSTPFGRH